MIDYTYRDFQELTFEEFLDMIWNNYVSEKIVSTNYYQENFDFISALTYDFYRMFTMDSCLTLRIICRMIESFFFNLFRHQAPSTDEIC